ncbi:hypothetical protein DFP73DRAFT_1850 [Morchella snyderi]|nr:hypothetical protein DFP73DRAFT_1850 [Morchella snyderi]
MASISSRISIRWPNTKPHEPTNTLVLTTPKRFFVDLRVMRTAPHNLYWGFAGISHKSESGDTGRWVHTVDSRYDTVVEDSGTFTQLANGDWLERGTMLDFDTGLVGDYEEVWRDSEPEPRAAAVLVLGEHAQRRVGPESDASARGCVVRLGRWCQGVMKVDGKVTAERWVLGVGESEWSRVWKCGEGVMPCMVACVEQRAEEVQGRRVASTHGASQIEVRTEIHEGDEIELADYKWRVVEKATW